MNYEEAVAYIDETPKFTKKNSLDHLKLILSYQSGFRWQWV